MNLWPVEPFCPHFFFQISTGKKVRTKGFNWSEVHLYRSSFLQNHTLGIDGKSTLSEKETSMITVLPNVTYFVKLPSFFWGGGHFGISGKIHHLVVKRHLTRCCPVQCRIALMTSMCYGHFLIKIFWGVVFRYIILFLLIFSLLVCFLCWTIWWISITYS